MIKPDFLKKLDVSSASGLLRIDGKFYAVADDELNLISFAENGHGKDATLELFQGNLPKNSVERKKVKPDLEAICFFSALNAILALPSGSKPNRSKGVLFRPADSNVTPVDFSGLFEVLNQKIKDLNLEGLVEIGNTVRLFHRGNAKGAVNSVVILRTDIFLAELRSGLVTAASLLEIRGCSLGLLHEVPLSFTDAAIWETNGEKKIVFLAAAERTESTYEDGEFCGAILGILDDQCKVVFTEEILCPQKPEGLWVENNVFYFVTDADDPKLKSELYKFNLTLI